MLYDCNNGINFYYLQCIFFAFLQFLKLLFEGAHIGMFLRGKIEKIFFVPDVDCKKIFLICGTLLMVKIIFNLYSLLNYFLVFKISTELQTF
jgi:hypothetical protein